MSEFTFLDSVQFDERRKVTTLNVTPDGFLVASTAEESIDGDRPLVLVVDDSPARECSHALWPSNWAIRCSRPPTARKHSTY